MVAISAVHSQEEEGQCWDHTYFCPTHKETQAKTFST